MKKLNIKVRNMTNTRGTVVANQFIIETEERLWDREQGKYRIFNVEYFQSYNTIIAKKTYGHPLMWLLDENKWDYSATTGKYRNQFLNENIAETRKNIAGGVYKLVNLN